MLHEKAVENWITMLKKIELNAGHLCAHSQVIPKLSWVRRVPCHLNVDLPADAHPCHQSEVHVIRAIDEFLKFLCCDSLADFPDTEGRSFRANGTERMVVRPRL